MTPGELPAAFFDDCALVCVDIQEGEAHRISDEADLPDGWTAQGFTLEDVNEALDHAFQVALPNAVRVAEACLATGIPRIFIHWGYRFLDGMDLEPPIRDVFLSEFGTDYARWTGHIDRPTSQVSSVLGVTSTDYVVPKAGQDAFDSSTLPFVLRNLRTKRLVMMGGHTGACLGRTAASALAHGYEVCVVEDATNDARESTRIPNLDHVGYHYRVTTDHFLSAVSGARHEARLAGHRTMDGRA